MNSLPKLLSKTKLIRGYRCQKCMYLTIHHPELERPISADTQSLFDQGNLVGTTARNYFPGGVLVNNPHWDFSGALVKTRELIAGGASIIYEAAFAYMGCYARADIIQFSPDSKRWRIYEVKSSTKIKVEHIIDVGLQTWIIAKNGMLLEQINIMHLNPECRYPDLSNLFITQDVTNEMRKNYLDVQPKINTLFTTLRSNKVPDIEIGPHCLNPTECGFIPYCWNEKNVPELSVFNLPGIKERKWELYSKGILELDDPRLSEMNELQERMIHTYKSGKRYVDDKNIQLALFDWKFPLTFLDFETINPAIPRYQGRGPFQHVPFQFSIHIWENPEAEITHIEFLHESTDDPRPTLIPALLKACGEEGSIVAYYSQFESERIRELIEYSPIHSAALNNLINRMVDPLPIIRQWVYDNAFQGSFSLKKVAPALLGQAHSYHDMIIANGNDAQRGFEEMILPETSVDRKIILKQAMLEYCKKDTFVLVELVKWLYSKKP